MFKRILVPLDGSALAERAVPMAVQLARAAEGVVLLLRVANGAFQDYEQQASFVTPVPLDLEGVDRVRRDALHYLTALAGRPDLTGIDVEEYVERGSVATTILDAAQTCTADLIVMSSHGRTGVARWMLGSVAQKVVRHAIVPVLVIPRDRWNAEPGGASGRAPCALVAVDGSPLAEAAVVPAARVAAAWAAPAQTELHLIRILRPGPASLQVSADTGDMDPEARQSGGHSGGYDRSPSAADAAGEYLSGLVDRLHQGPLNDLDVRVTWSVAFGDDVAASLVAEAEHRDTQHVEPTDSTEQDEPSAGPLACDLLAMATHGRGGLARWAMGSITERVLGATRVPLLVVRPRLPTPTAPLQQIERTEDLTPTELPPLY